VDWLQLFPDFIRWLLQRDSYSAIVGRDSLISTELRGFALLNDNLDRAEVYLAP